MNRLGKATSPYLRQHADIPVHWREWDGGALTESGAVCVVAYARISDLSGKRGMSKKAKGVHSLGAADRSHTARDGASGNRPRALFGRAAIR